MDEIYRNLTEVSSGKESALNQQHAWVSQIDREPCKVLDLNTFEPVQVICFLVRNDASKRGCHSKSPRTTWRFFQRFFQVTHFLVAEVQEYRTSTEAARQIGIENDGGVGRRSRC